MSSEYGVKGPIILKVDFRRQHPSSSAGASLRTSTSIESAIPYEEGGENYSVA